MTSLIILITAIAVVPMIVAGFLWPADWPLIWRQATIAFWGLGLVFVAELRIGRGSIRQTLFALGYRRPRRSAASIAMLAALAMFLCSPLLALADGATWGLQPGWPVVLSGVILVNGISEEVIHRSFLYRRLRADYSFATATAIAAAFFAAQHLYLVASIGVLSGLASMILALLLTYPFVFFYEHNERSILAPAILHTGTNASLILFLTSTLQQVFLMQHMLIVLASLYGATALLAVLERKFNGTPGVDPCDLGELE
jgi:membrane protease YdiL (CAAX protease family)